MKTRALVCSSTKVDELKGGGVKTIIIFFSWGGGVKSGTSVLPIGRDN